MKELRLIALFVLAIPAISSAQWYPVNSSTTAYLNQIQFVNNNTGFVVGALGTILKTTDAGENWTILNSGTSVDLLSIHMVNQFVGFVGCPTGKVLKTTDGGGNWTQYSLSTAGDLWGMYFLDVNTGYVTGSPPALFKTTNGGVNWLNQTPATPFAILAVHFIDYNTGFVAGHAGQIYKTTNAGNNWNFVSIGNTQGHWGMHFPNSNTGFIVGDFGRIYRTSSTGSSWNLVYNNLGDSLRSVNFPSDSSGFTCGYNGLILKTVNSGISWTDEHSGTIEDLRDVYFLNNNTGFVCGSGGIILKTTNSGSLTGNTSIRIPTPGFFNYINIPYQPSMNSFGNNITIEGWIKWDTADGGWVTLLDKSNDYGLYILDGTPRFRTPSGIVDASGMNVPTGVWTHLAVTSNEDTVKFYKNGVLGYSEHDPITLGSSSNDIRLCRWITGNVDEVRLWSVARSGTDIMNDICKRWPGTFSDTTGLLAVWHLDGTVEDSVSGYNGSIKTIGFYDFPATCLVTSVNQIGSQIPQGYILNQNYPNPFNPTTKIKFEIPNSSLVRLTVYDILGRQVEELVNENLNAGTYEYNLNGTTLSSGVYFYKLEAADFVETKRMVLLK